MSASDAISQAPINGFMKTLFSFLVNQQSLLYKLLVYFFCGFSIVYVLPRAGQFKYEIQRAKTWNYPSLYAPFDFSLIKTEAELESERSTAKQQSLTYFDYNTATEEKVKKLYEQRFQNYFAYPQNSKRYQRYFDYGLEQISAIYKVGVLSPSYIHSGGETVGVIKTTVEEQFLFAALFDLNQLSAYLTAHLDEAFKKQESAYYQLFFEILEPNLTYNQKLTESVLAESYAQISSTKGLVNTGELIVNQGELIDDDIYQKLDSLKKRYSASGLSDQNFIWITLGQSILVLLILGMLLLFIYKYRKEVFDNNTKMTFLLVNLLLMVLLNTSIINFNSAYLYIIPVCIFPLVIKAFFDARLGLFVHVLSVILVGLFVPNSFEYIVLQILAGIVTILGVSELYKRANLFISVAQITAVYLVGYFAFYIIQEGGLRSFPFSTLGLFFINGLLTLFVQPLIYLYEKLFQMDSDISLLELSDTHSPLLVELSNKAPGTFHHALQVANLAEAAAASIKANVLLTRVGALYHDIGKIKQPTYFSENQRGRVSLHDELSPLESAKIIIQHVLDGIEIAKKYNLPDRVIDFIRTHHGTSSVYYFLKKAQETDPDISTEDFHYKGPKPFSKETAILMMSDAVEAASKSLKEPTVATVKSFVIRIIDRQLEDAQFIQSNITLAEIETVKKVLIHKLIDIYHLRIEYPE